MTEKTPAKSPQLEAAELRKVIAEAEKAEIEAKQAVYDLKMSRYWDKLRKQEHNEKSAYDFKHGIYYLNTGISGASVKVTREWLNEYSRLHPNADIRIVLNSPGGSVFDGFDLMDCIAEAKDRGHHVTTVVAGMSASMAGVIFQMGHDRVIGRHSRLHLHEVSTGSIGKASDIKDTAELAESLTRQICDVYADRAREAGHADAWTADQIFDWIDRQERWLTAAEAVAMGFADRVG
jgi:ATP-dependent protease ClpP protease subunit